MHRRLPSALRWMVHGWQHPHDFDFDYSVRSLEARLRRLERVLDSDPWHEDSDVYAQEIRRFLVLIGDWRDPFRVVPRPDCYERYMDQIFTHRRAGGVTVRGDISPLERLAISDHYETCRKVEENAWNDAWALYRERARCWWC
jgi:hypothetical protein